MDTFEMLNLSIFYSQSLRPVLLDNHQRCSLSLADRFDVQVAFLELCDVVFCFHSGVLLLFNLLPYYFYNILNFRRLFVEGL
jgi:hypothetical protein